MDIFWLVFLGGLIFLIVVGMREEKKKREMFVDSVSSRMQRLDNLMDKLAEICRVDTSKSGRSVVFEAAEKQCANKWYHYRTEHKISGEILDSKSSLGKCTCSPEYFYYGVDTSFIGTSSKCAAMYASLPSPDKDLSNYSHSELSAYSDKITSATNQVVEYTCILTASKYPFAKSIPLKDIKMYRIEGNVHYTSDVSGGGANLGGAVAGGLLFGGAGAVVGSKVGTNIQTETVKTDDRKIALYYLEHNALKVEKIDCDGDIDDTLEVLRKLIPQKDEAMLQLQNRSGAPQ